MKQNESSQILEVFNLGVMAGIRSNSSPATASHLLSNQYSPELANSPLKFMQSPVFSNVLKVLAIGELIGDKLPSTGDRIAPVSIVFRCSAGALAGASIYKANGNNAVKGALIGAAAAFGSTFASFYMRKAVVDTTGIYDPIVGIIEDAIVAGCAVHLTKRRENESPVLIRS
jgi:uncharacterized membrane protein